MGQRSFRESSGFHLPHALGTCTGCHPEKVPGRSQGFLQDVQKHPGVVQAESAVGIRPAAALENPLDPRVPQTHCLPPSASVFSKLSSSNTIAWQCPGHSHCGIWPPPVWGQLITSIWRYRLLNLSLLAKDLLFLLNFLSSLQRKSRSQRLRLERSAFPARAAFARLL